MPLLEKLFGFDARTMTVRTELVAGLTTFMTMCYILAVNPAILSATGMDRGALFTATALASAIADGVCFGILTFVLTKLLTGKWHDLNITLVILAALFVLNFVFG